MRPKPNIQDFLGGANAVEKPATVASPNARARMTKTIRLGTDVESALKDRAYERTKASGQRVTESDIIDEALRKYLGI